MSATGKCNRTIKKRYAGLSAEVAEKVVQNFLFFAPQILGESPEIFVGHL